MKHRTKIMTRLAAVAGLALSVAPVNAAAVFVTDTSFPNTPDTLTDELAFAGDVSSIDLLNGLTGTIGGTFAGGNVANLTNGLGRTIDSSSVEDLLAAVGEITWVGDSGSSVEFVLGAGDGLGYDISGVTSFADWDGAGFMNQSYEIYLRELGGSYALYTTVDYQPSTTVTDPFLDQGGATKVNVTDDLGLLGSGIDAIRFDFLDTYSEDNGGTVFSEIDVFGIATVPEPSSTALLGLGAMAIALRRRRV
jgi:hypothetical protein